MTEKDVLQILKKGFRKLTLKKIRKIHGYININGLKQEKYLGLFQFQVPLQIKFDGSQINFIFIKKLLYKFKKELKTNVVKNFIKKVFKNDILVKKQILKYVFNIEPKNIASFRYYKNKRLIKLVVIGYCLKK